MKNCKDCPFGDSCMEYRKLGTVAWGNCNKHDEYCWAGHARTGICKSYCDACGNKKCCLVRKIDNIHNW